MLGAVAGLYDFDWEEAGRRFRNAMASAVVPPLVRGLYAYSHLMPLGRPEEAIQELDRALRADPLNFSYRMPHAMCLAALGRDEQAIDEMRRVLELTASPVTYGALGMFQYLRGDWEEARRTLAKAASIPNSAGLLAALLHRTGEISRAGEILRNFPADSVDGTRARAVFSCACGDLDTAVDWWERAIEMRDIAVPFALQIWFARVLRGTPHRARLMRKLNLPE